MPSLFGSSARQINKDYVIASVDRVPLKQKITYGLGTFIDMWGHWLYPNFAFMIFGTFLGVASWLIGVALIVHRLIDGISDPLWGWISDRTRTRIGRRRPFMYVGAVLAGIGLPFLFAVTAGWGKTHLFGLEISNYFWFMILSAVVYLPMVGCFNMPYQSLGNEMTPDFHERTTLFSFKNIIQKFPEVGLFFAGMFCTSNAWVGATFENLPERLKMLFTTSAAWTAAPEGTKPNMLLGAQTYTVICGVIMIVAGLICAVSVRERYYNKLVATHVEKTSVRQMFSQTFHCQPFRIQVVMQIAYQLGTSMLNSLGYAATIFYVCSGNMGQGNFYNFLMGLAYMVFGLLGVPVFAVISRYLGKRQALMTVFGLGILVFLSTWWLYTPQIKWLQIFASGMISFCNAGFWLLSGSIGADVIDYDELQTGRRREGAFASCGSWVMKMGMALGAGISLFILSWIGLVNQPGAIQSEHTILLLRILIPAIPITGMIVGLIALAKFPLTQEKTMEIRAQLEARRGKV